MKLNSDKLAPALKKQCHPLIWLAGDEPLLMQEAADEVRAHYRGLDFSEREVFYTDAGFDWGQFRQSMGNLSLFASRRLMELRLSGGKLDDGGKAALEDYLKDPGEDRLVLVISPRMEGSTLRTKWFKSIESRSLLVQVWPVTRDRLGGWLEQRLRRAGMEADRDAVGILMDRVEGNLMAAVQEIEKLKLRFGPAPSAKKSDGKKDGGVIRLDGETVMKAVADNSRSDAFLTVDAALLGESARAQRLLHGLQAEGNFPTAVLGALTYMLRSLLPLLERRAQGQPVPGIVESAGIHFSRKQAVAAAVKRLHPADIWALLQQARLIDQASKGLSTANPWDELSILLLRLSGTATATTAATTSAPR